MKFLYRFNSAPAGRYYSESWARENLPVRQMDRNVGKHLHCGILWYDKNNQPWVVVNRCGNPVDFSGIEEAYKFLTDQLNSQEVPFCITFG